MTFDTHSVPELIYRALQQSSALIKNEVRLATAEMKAKPSLAAVGIGLVAAGSLTGIAALVLILMALAAWFVTLGLSVAIANLAAGMAGLLVSGGLVWVGLSRLTPAALTPDRTIHQLEQDAAVLREQAR